jgi:hypothetical protein
MQLRKNLVATHMQLENISWDPHATEKISNSTHMQLGKTLVVTHMQLGKILVATHMQLTKISVTIQLRYNQCLTP